MKNTITNRFILLIVLMHVLTLVCFSQQQIDLNLDKLSLNNLPLNELTLDKITDILGRPTATNNNPLISDAINVVGVQIFYHSKGIMFWFNPKNSDPDQKIWFMKVYLVKKWDQEYNEFYLPFSGKITPYINPDMKINKLLSIFSKYKPELIPAPEARKNHETRMKKLGLTVSKSDIAHDQVYIKREKGSLLLRCEELTKFLEYFT